MGGRAKNFARWGAIVGASALAGCVSYAPQPLDTRPRLVTSSALLQGRSAKPLRIADLDRLVLVNNPDLQAGRARRGIGAAQLLQAGVLPNPQLTASYPFFVAGPGTVDGFELGLSQDLKSLLLRPAKRESAAAAGAEVEASLIWQEWQTISKARLLFVDLVFGDRLRTLIQRNRKLLQERFDLANAAIGQGNGTLATLSPDLVALGDIQKSADDLDRLQLSRRHQLAALFGLSPDAPFTLAASLDMPRFDAPAVRARVATLAARRPDLVALQYGYRSEDAKLRQSILAQFPNVTVGIAGGRDTEGVYSLGPQVTIELPIFDSSAGTIAIEQATREALGREFNARLTAATGEVLALISEQALLARQLAALEPRLKEAKAIAAKTDMAYRQGSFDERAYVDVEVAALTREQEKLGLQQAVLEGQVALATLIGAGLPDIAIPPEPPPADPLGLLQAASRL